MAGELSREPVQGARVPWTTVRHCPSSVSDFVLHAARENAERNERNGPRIPILTDELDSFMFWAVWPLARMPWWPGRQSRASNRLFLRDGVRREHPG